MAMQGSDPVSPVLGRLGRLGVLRYHEPILVVTFAVVAIGGLAVLGAISYFRLWGYLWREWFTSVDHKRIGIMYIILGLVMLLRGFADALMMRAAAGDGLRRLGQGYLPAHHYDQIFTAHGVIMIFFVAMPLVTGLMNFVVPLQIGARDVSFPFLNNFSFWMTVGRRRARHDVAVRRRIRPHRLAGLSAAVRASPTAPTSASITTSGRCRSPASARCCPAST